MASRFRPLVLLAAIAVSPVAATVSAQDRSNQKAVVPSPKTSPKQVVNGPYFGTSTVVWQTISAPDFDPDSACSTTSCTEYTSTWTAPLAFNYRRTVISGYEHVFASPRLPGGSLLTSIEYDFCDTNTGGLDITFNLWDCDFTGSCNATPLHTFTTPQNVGCQGQLFNGALAYTVDNSNRRLLIEVIFGAANTVDYSTNTLAGVSVGYTLQVSAAPGSPTFNDVPASDPAFQFVEALAASGITAGCGGGNYCPDNPLTRRQMAVFLAKALGLNWGQ